MSEQPSPNDQRSDAKNPSNPQPLSVTDAYCAG